MDTFEKRETPASTEKYDANSYCKKGSPLINAKKLGENYGIVAIYCILLYCWIGHVYKIQKWN